jgi:hypothetical protein
MSLAVDLPSLLVDGETYARLLPEAAQGRVATVAGALTIAAYWAGAAAFLTDHPATVPLRKSLGYRSGREFMLRFPLPDRGRRRRNRGDDALLVAGLAAYPVALWLAWDHGRRARPGAA